MWPRILLPGGTGLACLLSLPRGLGRLGRGLDGRMGFEPRTCGLSSRQRRVRLTPDPPGDRTDLQRQRDHRVAALGPPCVDELARRQRSSGASPNVCASIGNRTTSSVVDALPARINAGPAVDSADAHPATGSRVARGRPWWPRPGRVSPSQSGPDGGPAEAKAQPGSQAVPAVEKPAAHTGAGAATMGAVTLPQRHAEGR